MNDIKRQPQLLEQLDIAEKLVAVCQELSHRLQERLAGVLRPEQSPPPIAANGRGASSPDELLVPAAERVRGVSRQLQSSLSLLQGILERLEA